MIVLPDKNKYTTDIKKYEADKKKYDEAISKAHERLNNIVQKNNKNKFINVFRLESEEGGQDLEELILRAFVNCNIFWKFIIRILTFRNLKSLFFLSSKRKLLRKSKTCNKMEQN